MKLIIKIVQSCGIIVQAGGGIRTLESVRKLLEAGVSRVVFGTAAIKEPELIKQAVLEFGERIAVGIDARNGKAAADGWETTSCIDAIELAEKVETLGVKTIIYTDISRDGMLEGPNTAAMEKMKRSTGMKVIASGGVSRIQDIIDLRNCAVDGVIIGKALYTGDIDLPEAIKIASIV
jgi:phosphoribosylformimino-5-aminoimidazole carboxamide ribotide isomerase